VEKKKVLDFLNKQQLGVLSTVTLDGNPESAVVGFGVMDNLELFFGTQNYTRKYKNLIVNKNVSFVTGWDDNITIQYEGISQELSANDGALNEYKETYFAKNPNARKYINAPGQTFFKVFPIWIRYSNLNTNPKEIFEIKF